MRAAKIPGVTKDRRSVTGVSKRTCNFLWWIPTQLFNSPFPERDPRIMTNRRSPVSRWRRLYRL